MILPCDRGDTMLMKKNIFSKKYPLFDKYINDENMRINMCKNQDLMRKYNNNTFTIEIFIKELERIFDVETIADFIKKVILNLPDNVMISFITSYLNSKDSAKANMNVLSYYNKTAMFGIESIKYMEEHGIITDRTYKEIPNKAKLKKIADDEEQRKRLDEELNKEYNEIKTGNEIYQGDSLDNIYTTLTVEEKIYLNDLLKNNMFYAISKMFSRFNYSLKQIINLLLKNNIDLTIINPKVVNYFSEYELTILIYLIIDYGNSKIIDNMKILIDIDKIEVIKQALINDTLKYFDELNKDDIINRDTTTILNLLSSINLNKTRKIVGV